MATFDYASLKANTVTPLLQKFGATKTLVREAESSYDPVTDVTVPGITENYSGNAVMTMYNRIEIDNTNILANDRKVLWDGEEPRQNDKIDDFRVVRFERVSPDDASNVMYILQVRK